MLEGVKFINEMNLKSKKVFIRVDFNIPIKNGIIQDRTRIDEAMKTVNYTSSMGAKVILASHLGRPKGVVKKEFSLKPVAEYISEHYYEIDFADDCIGESVKSKVSSMSDSDVLLLENLRFHAEEESNSKEFAEQLGSLCDVYINDAFGSSHRAHASVDALPRIKKEKAAGFLMKKELEYFDILINKPDRPFYAVLGGAKVSDKAGVIESLLDKVNKVFIGGAMAYTFLSAMGFQTGKSKVEDDLKNTVNSIVKKAEAKNVPIILPVDHVCSNEFAGRPENVSSRDIPDGLMGLDIGENTVKVFKKEMEDAKTVMWNGPMGVFEFDAFSQGTFEVAKFLSGLNAVTVVGGGDSVSAVKKSGVSDKIDHISTGGGASLELIEESTLVGIEALQS